MNCFNIPLQDIFKFGHILTIFKRALKFVCIFMHIIDVLIDIVVSKSIFILRSVAFG